ncbi:hypothetical protein [uncultured Rikenella sp.]|uniref:hypothetical protein n=1 Tax=uncultured Rikenella sp. TaxID=368003 RepID=UPI0026244A2C|nr:hypothetical protein [uncultured Rikenella sp.]
MKRNLIQNDPLERLFAAAREQHVSDGGFTERVVGRIEPVPPSRNLYRIPTLATAFASVLLIVWVALWGENFIGFAGQLADNLQDNGVRLVPKAWIIPHTSTRTSEHADN